MTAGKGEKAAMLGKMDSSISTFRAQHPRYFLAGLCGCFVIALYILTGPHDGNGVRDAYLYPPPKGSGGQISNGMVVAGPGGAQHGDAAMGTKHKEYPAFGPRDLTAAVQRSEELWEESRRKRVAFIKEKGGLAGMRMFSDKAWVGYGQMYTLW